MHCSVRRLIPPRAQAEPPAINWAVKVAQEIGARVESPRHIVLITDRCARDAVHEATTSGVEVLRVGTAASNCAITCFAARRSKTDPTQCESTSKCRIMATRRLKATWSLRSMASAGLQVPFAVENNGHWQTTLDKVAISSAVRLTARITPGDSYPFDDTADIRLDLPAEQNMNHPMFQQQSEGGVARLYRSIILSNWWKMFMPDADVTYCWLRVIRRRSQRSGITWELMDRFAAEWLPEPKILHPYPNLRFNAKHPW